MKMTTPRWASLGSVALLIASMPAVHAAPARTTDVQEYTAPAATTEMAYGYFIGEASLGPVKSKRLGFVGFTAPAGADTFSVEIADDTGLPVAAWLAYGNPRGKTTVTLICGPTGKPLPFDPQYWVTVWPAAGECDGSATLPTHGEVAVTFLSD